MRLYGITGGIGSGKSAVTAILRRHGFKVFDLDEIARDLVVPESEGLGKIVETFGAGYLTLDGHLDRKRLAATVFSDPAELAKLDAIMGPLLWDEVLRRSTGIEADVAFVDGALLIEKGMHARLAGTVLVTAPERVRLRRAMERDGASAEQVRARMRTQMSDDEKRKAADFVIDNAGGIRDLEDKVRGLVRELAR